MVAATITTFSSRDFNQHTSEAKKATSQGPVFITDRGRPAHVLLSIEEYRRLTGSELTLVDALAQHAVVAFEFEAPQAGEWHRRVELD